LIGAGEKKLKRKKKGDFVKGDRWQLVKGKKKKNQHKRKEKRFPAAGGTLL